MTRNDIPQKPYLPIGTFRDQIIYPDTVEDMKSKGITDLHLENVLQWVNLTRIHVTYHLPYEVIYFGTRERMGRSTRLEGRSIRRRKAASWNGTSVLP